MTRASSSSSFVLVVLMMVSTAVADRVRLPRDHRDEVLDAEDARGLNANEYVKYAMRRHGDGDDGDAATAAADADAGLEGQWVEQISATPRAYVYRNFLTRRETEHLVRLAHETMGRSEVVDDDGGNATVSEDRTSSGGWIRTRDEEDEVVRDIELRVAAWTMLPRNRGETIQVMKYGPGEEYKAHHDFFYDDVNVRDGGQRVATVLMYLSDVEEGGETVFPLGVPLGREWSAKSKSGGKEDDFKTACERARRGDGDVLAVKPRRGDALLFYNAHLNGELDELSLHAGCPVVRGVKWTATRWQRVGAVGIGSFAPHQ